jgi:uncharacterized protein with HEPN domain
MNESDLIRLRHMLDAAYDTQSFIEGYKRDDLNNNRMLLFALVRAIEVIGEAAAHIEAETQAETSQIPWPQIIGMRNRLIHGYFDVNPDLVWKTVTEDIPPLIAELKKLIPPEMEEGKAT